MEVEEATSVVAVAAVFLARSGEVDFSRFFFVDILFEQKAQEKEREAAVVAGMDSGFQGILWPAASKCHFLDERVKNGKKSLLSQRRKYVIIVFETWDTKCSKVAPVPL
jgi:hypothetical protein